MLAFFIFYYLLQYKIKVLYLQSELKNYIINPRLYLINIKTYMEDIQKNIAQAIRKLYSIALDNWVSVREQPISEIFSEFNINRKYNSAISNVLRDAGLLFTEGEKGAMRYKFQEVAVLDADTLAMKAIELEKLAAAQYRASRPKRNKQPKESTSTKTIKLKKEPLPLGTVVYFLNYDCIVEGEIYSSKLSDPGSNRLYDYEVRFIYENEVCYIKNPRLFLNPKELVDYYLNNIIKYNKSLVETLIEESEG